MSHTPHLTLSPGVTQKNVLLNFLDRPPRILIFTYDQVGGFIGTFLIFTLAFNLPETGMIMGLLWVLLLPSFKKRLGAGSWKRVLYWYMPTHESSQPYLIPSYIREWIA